MSERASAPLSIRSIAIRVTVSAVLVLVAVDAQATHRVLDLTEKCQLAFGRALGKYTRDRIRCVAACYEDATAGVIPASDCAPPFAGSTHECVERAEEKLDRAFYYPECSHCPQCYMCTVGDARFDHLEATRVAPTESWVDGIAAAVFCDDGGSADGLTAAEMACAQRAAKAVGQFTLGKARCLNKCRRNEAKGRVDAGLCPASAVTDGATTACVTSERNEAGAEIAACADAPECLTPNLPGLLGMVDAGVEAVDQDLYCSVPLACGDALAVQCDGTCPVGEACTDMGGQCVCQPAALACGVAAGAPACWGSCPPETPICHDDGGECHCVNR